MTATTATATSATTTSGTTSTAATDGYLDFLGDHLADLIGLLNLFRVGDTHGISGGLLFGYRVTNRDRVGLGAFFGNTDGVVNFFAALLVDVLAVLLGPRADFVVVAAFLHGTSAGFGLIFTNVDHAGALFGLIFANRASASSLFWLVFANLDRASASFRRWNADLVGVRFFDSFVLHHGASDFGSYRSASAAASCCTASATTTTAAVAPTATATSMAAAASTTSASG